MTTKQAEIKRWERVVADPRVSDEVKAELRKAIAAAKGK
jgi:hypothetical protein